jgi:predicted amidohydrolase YtcJ
MRRIHILAVIAALFTACQPDYKSVNTLFHNGNFYVMDSTLKPYQSLLVRDGKILAIGSANELSQMYQIHKRVNMEGKHIFPGWHDAHCHFWGYGMTLQQVDLSNAQSWQEVVDRCIAFNNQHQPNALIGRGWDQNLWEDANFPTNELLNQYFPNKPILLKRVDGHAAIANQYLLDLAHINSSTKIPGGEIILEDGKPTGVLIDNAVDQVQQALPPTAIHTHIKALLAAQDTCISYGITTVTDAGLPTSTIMLIDSLQKLGLLKIKINAMVSISNEALDFWLKKGTYETNLLRVGSFKMYADGALGSRGACLLKPYHDANHNGLIITNPTDMWSFAQRIADSDFQLNTHCIGDSANRLLMQYYAKAIGGNPTKRWRIEHAQIVNPDDLYLYAENGIIPSVQPTHATSDMYWAPKRLGLDRISHAYTYQTLLQRAGIIALGTDFPVEQVNPLLTLYAAVTRKDANNFPADGFLPNEALTKWQTLYGMTVWPAFAAKWENKTGNLYPGMFADFVVYDEHVLSVDPKKWLDMRPQSVYISGKKLY